MARIGILGGSFNPVHVAHLVLAEWVRVDRQLERVLFLPAGRPPHKSRAPLAPARHRARMLELALEGNRAFEMCRVELDSEGPSYTLRTVRQLRRRFGQADELFLLLGADSLLDLPHWWQARKLVEEVSIIAFGRPGYELERRWPELADEFGGDWVRVVKDLMVAAPLLNISATAIRERLRAGLSIRYLVPEPVREYILAQRLYVEGRR
ncbi:MAG: nicotinate-nucleotide adenylyltransferase [Planctomycetes bacterium]|nr:nicotinate-nucleotide adenylyltransferase [Planctomycetota bacterium]